MWRRNEGQLSGKMTLVVANFRNDVKSDVELPREMRQGLCNVLLSAFELSCLSSIFLPNKCGSS